MKKIVYLLLIVFALIGCTQPGGFGPINLNQQKYGSIEIITSGNQNKCINIDETRSIVLSDITAAKVTVSGFGFTDLQADTTSITGGGSGSNVTINNIPIGKNRVVTVQAKIGTEDMTGIVIRAVVDIAEGNNSVTVNWASTALGNVFYDLLKTHSYDIGGISDTLKNNIISAISGSSVSHNSLINYSAIATDVKNNALKTGGDASYKIATTSATFTLKDVTDFNGLTAQINDPSSSPLTVANLAAGVNTITGIKPGNWELVVSLNGGVVYRSGVKTIGASVYNFSEIELLSAAPYFTPTNSVFSGSASVVIETSTTGAEVYYTTNGSEPTTSSTKYTAPINVTEDTTIKAKAFKSNFIPSATTTKSYTKQISSSIGENHPATGAYSPKDSGTWATATYALGSHFVSGAGSDATFAVYSKNATKVLLEIYDDNMRSDAKYDYWMTKGSDNIWRAKLTTIPDKTLYAFRVWGPNWDWNASWTRGNSASGFVSDCDANGHRFNPNKVVYDPYGREMSHDKENPTMTAAGENGGMYGTGATDDATPHGYSGPCTGNVNINRRNVDTGKWAPKSVLFVDSTSFGTKPAIPQKDAIIYEAHARGMTKHPSSVNLSTILNGITGFESVVSVPDSYRGTYKGAGYMAKYLKALGFNTIELLPVHETANDVNPDDNPGGNYWGYMTYSYFAPDRRYAYDKSYGGPTKEFKEMVKAFHDEGLEVYLDVVYNHTGEGGNWDAAKIQDPPDSGTWIDNPAFTTKCAEITSFRGFDNAEYYALVDGNKGLYWESTGCGNNLYTNNPPVKQFVLDSLTYWIDVMGVDGYRFDLAPVIGRENPPDYSFNTNNGTITAIASLGATKNVEMIAEAWDCQWPGGYQVSNFPSGWGEWNGFYRDSVRKFIKGDGNKTTGYPSFTDVFHGSYGPLDRSSGNTHTGFNDNGGPHKSVNFIIAHDGFTLMDLVSYGGKQNTSLSWPFGPSDGGSNDNDSSSYDGDQIVRRQQLRNLWTIQFFSRGVPMTVWGDEFGRTQNGNNNPYNIDSVVTWNNYNMINTDSPNDISTGGSGTYHNNFGTDSKADGKNNLFLFVKELTKIRNAHHSLRQSDYSVGIDYKKEDGTSSLADGDKCIWIRIDGSSKGDHDFLLFINSHIADVSYTIPAADSGKEWRRIIDTQASFEANDNIWAVSSGAVLSGSYGVKARSVVVLEEVPTSGVETVAIPEINLATGVYTSTQSLAITSATSGATIKYTLDGTDPATSGTAVSGTSPINLSLTAAGGNGKGGYQVKAIAIKSGMNNSPVEERRYAITAPYTITTTFGSDVMLQGFHWDSCKTRDTVSTYWYVIMNNNAVEIRDNFQWVWFPPATAAADGPRPTYREGYMPTQLNLLTGDYGTEAELSTAIASIYNSGIAGHSAKAIADIVINHRCGSTTWSDFTNPTMGIDTTNEYYRAITWGDNAFTNNTSPQYNLAGENRGWGDTGTDFESARDLDHTNVTVQNDIVEWMNTKLKGVGFKGWRYDFVKGFDGKYVGYYNSKTSPDFSVGELWEDGTPQTGLDNWVSATANGGTKSMVFDFDTKAKLNSAFGWYKTDDTTTYYNLYPALDLLKSGYGTPAGYIGWRPENAVTFVDNHDTGSTQQHWKLRDDKVYLAYVYTLTHPGLPCVAWDHYFDSGASQKTHIKELINIRKTYGVTNTSPVTIDTAVATEYGARIGSGNIAVKIGTGMTYSPADYQIVYSGTDFAVWAHNSKFANLSGLTLSSGSLSPSFSGSTYSYSASVSNATSTITVTPSVPVGVTSTIQVQVNSSGYSSVTAGSPSGALALNLGANTIDVKVTSQDGTVIKNYTLTVTRLATVPYAHTITIDGNNDFDTAKERFLTTSGGTNYGYVTWDADYVYIGITGSSGAGPVTDNDRIVKLHFDTKTGGTTNAIWGGATLHANCSADYSIAFKTVDNSVSFNNGGTGSWTTQTPGVGELTFNKSTVNNLIEFKIKRTLIEATTSFKFAMFVGQDWSPYHVSLGLPEGSFTDADGSVTFTKYMEFDLTSESDPITQSPIKP